MDSFKRSTPDKSEIEYSVTAPHRSLFKRSLHEVLQDDESAATLETIDDKQATNGKLSDASCTCKNSRCLKLYCACFASGSICSSTCRCSNCENVNGSIKREQAVKRTKFIHPNAFNSRVVVSSCSTSMDIKSEHFKGCKCNRSNCLKKYCECFALEISCGEYCKCTDCLNCASAAEILQSEEFLDKSVLTDFLREVNDIDQFASLSSFSNF